MISDSEFRRLQKLASLSFSGDEEKKFIAQISNTINFLDQLKELDNILPKQNSISVDNPLRVINGVIDFENKKKIMNNVSHEIINNSIVIKSVL